MISSCAYCEKIPRLKKFSATNCPKEYTKAVCFPQSLSYLFFVACFHNLIKPVYLFLSGALKYRYINFTEYLSAMYFPVPLLPTEEVPA